MKHIRPLTVVQASDTFGSYLIEILLADFYNRLLNFVLESFFGRPAGQTDSKDT